MNTKIECIHDKPMYWETIARTRWGSYLTEVEKRAILKANDMAGKPTAALEIGCEGGRWSMLLAKRRWKMICTDTDPHTLAICQRRISTAQCILVSANDSTIPCETASIGLLLCIEVPQLIHSDWFIHEALRVLTSGGVLVGVVHNRFSHRAVAYSILSIFDSNRRKEGIVSSLYKFSYRKWKKQAGQAGFNIAYEEGFCWLPFSRDSNFFLIPQLTRLEHTIGLRHFTTISPWIAFVAQKI
jgi:ubiquinone/menaquinone biosynthesis C-methylase UbiE